MGERAENNGTDERQERGFLTLPILPSPIHISTMLIPFHLIPSCPCPCPLLALASSMTTWVVPDSPGSARSLLSSTPAVQKSSRVAREVALSPRMAYPTLSPGLSPLSAATLDASPRAATLLGCVTTMPHLPPSPASTAASRTNWGTWVDLPQPVSPEMTTTRWESRAERTAGREAAAGRDARCCARREASVPRARPRERWAWAWAASLAERASASEGERRPEEWRRWWSQREETRGCRSGGHCPQWRTPPGCGRRRPG